LAEICTTRALGGGYPPVFSYQGETKDLRENGLYQGDALDLVGEMRRKSKIVEEKSLEV